MVDQAGKTCTRNPESLHWCLVTRVQAEERLRLSDFATDQQRTEWRRILEVTQTILPHYLSSLVVLLQDNDLRDYFIRTPEARQSIADDLLQRAIACYPPGDPALLPSRELFNEAKKTKPEKYQ